MRGGNCSYVLSELGWQSSIPFEHTVAEVLDYYRPSEGRGTRSEGFGGACEKAPSPQL